MNKTFTALTIGASALSACAKRAEKVEPAYVSKSAYANLTCTNLMSERNDVVRQVNILSGEQNKAAEGDAVAMGVGLVLFWPALIFLAADNDKAPQLASAKGQYDALTAQMDAKGCKGV